MAHNEASAAGAALRCVVVTPERAVLDEPSDFVALPLYDGELGILPGRLPLIGRLGFGEMRLVRGQQTQRYYVDGGFAQVRDNVVTVLTARAVAATEILVETARADLQNAQQTIATTPEAQAAQDRQRERARAQLRIAGRGTIGQDDEH
jgi:F-type H+-transporting ATPase subunit epsilon